LKTTQTKKYMAEALRAAGCRITRQRRAILEYLAHTDAHPSANQVYEEAKKHCPGLSLATVYNTLETLVKMGLIKVMEFQAVNNRHETNITPHINLICAACGKIQDLQDETTIHLKKARERAGFEVHDCRLEYYGLCADCRSKKSRHR